MSEEGTQAEEPGDAGAEPDEEELRRRIEESLRDVRVQDVLLESVVTLINLTARRIGKPDERDLEQARVGIEAVRAVAELLDAEPRSQVRNALSELQVLYAREAGPGSGGAEGSEGAGDPSPAGPEVPDAAPERPGGGTGGRLWTPPGA